MYMFFEALGGTSAIGALMEGEVEKASVAPRGRGGADELGDALGMLVSIESSTQSRWGEVSAVPTIIPGVVKSS
jgi:hypothetical protein